MIPETFVARNILKRNWGVAGDLSVLSMGDNGCSWLCEADAMSYVFKASPTAWTWNDQTYHAWHDASRLCVNAVTFWPKIGRDEYRLMDGKWSWTLQTWVQGRQFNGTWSDVELVARQMRELTAALAEPSQDWLLVERNLYANLNDTERAKVNDWLIANRMSREWADAKTALESLVGWYSEGMRQGKKVITHYDIHPGNCIITPDDVVVFIDPTLCYGDPLQSLCFSASRFWPDSPQQFLAVACGQVSNWQAYAHKETVMRINWILRQNYIYGHDAWRGDLRKHLEYMGVE